MKIQYINFMLPFIIYLITLLMLLRIIRVLIRIIALATKYKHLLQYEITNGFYTLFCVIFYIYGPLLGLYCLKLSNINQTLDLKIIYKNTLNILQVYMNTSYIYTIGAIILILLLLIIILLTLLYIYKILNNQVYNLYLYITFNTQDRSLFFNLKYKLMEPFYSDIISYYIKKLFNYIDERMFYYKNNLKWEKVPRSFSEEYLKKINLYHIYCKNRSPYRLDRLIYHSYYNKLLIPYSPFLILIYDCVFNELVITHVYYYLPLFILLMLWRKCTILFSKENNSIGKLMWDILYKRESCIYALPRDLRKLFDVYIANGLKSIDLGPPAILDLDESRYIYESAQFIYNENEKLYYNCVDTSLELTEDNKFVYIYTNYDTQQEVKEEWFLIVKKQYNVYKDKMNIIISEYQNLHPKDDKNYPHK